jgi:hypothetical protein
VRRFWIRELDLVLPVDAALIPGALGCCSLACHGGKEGFDGIMASLAELPRHLPEW